jgi:carbon-monoxide dehydrogenase medium subunit
MWSEYVNAATVGEVIEALTRFGDSARVIAGGTDLILELERKARRDVSILIDISRVPALDRIWVDEADVCHLGPMVTHNHCVASKTIQERALPLAQAAWEVGAPQIRNRGTIAGNLITASPANDTITPLVALGAQVTLLSTAGERVVPLAAFYTGVRQTVMRPDEMLVDIAFPLLSAHRRGIFLKLGLRRSQAIAVVNVAVVLTFDRDTVVDAAIALGAVAPTIVRAREAEAYLSGRKLEEDTIAQAAQLAISASSPIDDIRGSAAYRREMVAALTARGLHALAGRGEGAIMPSAPVLLWGRAASTGPVGDAIGSRFTGAETISTRINGKRHRFTTGHDQTLLELLRDGAGLIGTKEGCAEGECGACTVLLDGRAVMSCLVPAARAHGAELITVEGLAEPERLHRVQTAFIHQGAVQCGFCTPGFLIAAATLLEEKPRPTRDEIRQAISGNLCRCTGYHQIVEAIETASRHG